MTVTQTMDCAWCGRTNPHRDGPDAHDEVRAGDAVICWGCVHLSVFDGTHIRRPTKAEQRLLAEDGMTQAMLLIVTKAKADAAQYELRNA